MSSVDIALTKPQRIFARSKAPFPAIVGGLGSGKSRGGTIRLVLLLIERMGCDVAYYMPTYDLIRLRAIPGVEKDLNSIGLEFKINKSEYTINVSGYGKIIFRSYDRPERIIAYEVAHSICDELDTLGKEKAAIVWRKISERNRQKGFGVNTIGCVTTPDQGTSGFIYQKWVKEKNKGYEIVKAPTYSNPFLPDGYIEQIRANYDPVMADLFIEGEFVSLSRNKVYHFFDREKHNTNIELSEKYKIIHIGLDFNVGGCCAVVFVIDNNTPVAVEEFVSMDTRDFVNNLAKYKNYRVVIYPDSSGKNNSTNASLSDIGIIKQAGYQVLFKSTNPAVRDRINSYNALLAHDRIKFNTNKVPELCHAMESQGYDKEGQPEKFKDHPSIDDYLDCAGYHLAYKYPVIKQSATRESMY